MHGKQMNLVPHTDKIKCGLREKEMFNLMMLIERLSIVGKCESVFHLLIIYCSLEFGRFMPILAITIILF